MKKPVVVLIAAVGNNGQLGLDGKLPWHDKEDLAFFRRMTLGKTVIVGTRTYEEVKHLNADRTVIPHPRSITVPQMIDRYTGLVDELFIAGGATTYMRWLPHVRHCLITKINYTGPADTLMPSLWNDQLPAIRENMQIVDMLSDLIKRDLKVGNTHSVSLVGSIKQALLVVRQKKWPFLKEAQQMLAEEQGGEFELKS